MKNLSGLLAVLAVFLYASISYGQEGFAKRINCGGDQVTYNNITFDVDNSTTNSPYSNGEMKYFFSSIADATKPYIGSIRYTKTPTVGPHIMNYTIEVPQLDQYDVIMHFKEGWFGVGDGTNGHNKRVFDVSIQGQQVENDLDLAKDHTGLIHTNTTRVTSTLDTSDNKYKISIDFEASLGDPIINGIEILGVASAPIPVTGVTLSPTTLDLEIGDNPLQLTHTISPSNASDPSISSWSSNNTAVATVNNGEVTPVGVGNATITVTTTDGSKIATTTVAVTDPNSQPLPAGDLWLSTNNTDTYISNNVGIGTTPQSSYKLAVNGVIHTKEVLVNEIDWADYVFFHDYKLPTLQEVEQHIQEKGHLINIPSASEVEANGIELGEMNKLLLEKIEELTLYMIQQEKRIKSLEKNK